MPRISRYKRRDSDRSGFTQWEVELVKDAPWKVSGDERDTPPPSRIPLGGEGDVSGEPRLNSGFDLSPAVSTDTGPGLGNPTVAITAAGGILPTFTHPWMRITGDGSAVTITAIPQIARGREGQVLTLQCVDSSVTLAHGSANAVNFMDSRGTLQLTSGMVLTLVFTTGNAAWTEASRFRP